MIETVPPLYRLAVDPSCEAVAEAGRRIVAAARAWRLLYGDALVDVKVCAAELAAQSVREVGESFTMGLSWTGHRARLEVVDSFRRPLEQQDWGAGLSTVAQVAGAWGVEVIPEGRLMWCEVAPDHFDAHRRLAVRLRAAGVLARPGTGAVHGIETAAVRGGQAPRPRRTTYGAKSDRAGA